MEDIIKKIEQYEAEHKIRYDAAMTKPFSEIVFACCMIRLSKL